MQSHGATESKTAINGDGFGLAWYGERTEPGLYRDIQPAWSDCNLRNLARQVRSPLFLAHVRASTGSPTSRQNCHPFVHGRWSFMHNGQIGGFEQLRRRLEALLGDRLFAARAGNTDSELLFLLALEYGLERDAGNAFGQAISTIEAAALALGEKPLVRCTASFSDGETRYAIRYSTDAITPTLYVSRSCAAGGICIVSEPLDGEAQGWEEVPAGSLVAISPQGIVVEPFVPHSGLSQAAE